MQYPIRKNVFVNLAITGTGSYRISLAGQVGFRCKSVVTNVAYDFQLDDIDSYTLTSNLTDQNVIGVINKYAGTDAGTYYLTEGFKDSNRIEYIYNSPMNVDGSYEIMVTKASNSTITSGNILLHFEFTAV